MVTKSYTFRNILPHYTFKVRVHAIKNMGLNMHACDFWNQKPKEQAQIWPKKLVLLAHAHHPLPPENQRRTEYF